ncbi:NAD-glutamate dehydrogenase [Grimontia hollisae]|uniref:NAD-specific glutamate dehydrogenase large form n=1 Tax=Grimontia hollisae CIP 101886 TaxID=675812 RepID=D0IAI4_GRIHO|nr:NAD-glutamate dehydrogenase [Grimontia hollisae]AMG31874.1 NAD-glutamate dehydrogenase [Grimontia hollisae]EEY70902.1 NAD-specific glutamate dehydrogenase large form [Grimontia hollisae CIP 101886]STO44571.1 NAD-specific glutamate dehydrogenase [Grimontia hollisae]
MTARDPIVPVLLEKVYHLIAEKLDKTQQPLVETLAKRILGPISDDDLQERNESDLYGAVISLWHHLNTFEQDKIFVKVFNPTLSGDGWQSTHTIVEILTPDAPFLVDSVRMALNRLDIASHLMLNGPLSVEKDAKGNVTSIGDKKGVMQSVFHLEIDRMCSKKEMLALEKELTETLNDVALIVNDWQPMQDKMTSVIESIKKDKLPVDKSLQQEALDFLGWIASHNFTFMAYKYYELNAIEGDYELKASTQEGLGLAKKLDPKRPGLRLSEMPESARATALRKDLLVINKASSQSRVHRPAYMDYIGIKCFDKKGNVVGEHRFHGLYASSAYNQATSNIPVLKNKVRRILETSGYYEGSHSWKALANIIENFPRDELFQASEAEMLDIGMGIVQVQDRDLLRVFVRRDPFGRFLSCMVYVARERYNTALRRTTQRILQNYFGSDQDVEFNTFFSESPLARTHYIVRVENNNFDIDVKKLEQNLTEAASTWDDRLKEAVITTFGENQGTPIAKRYLGAFPRSYKEAMLPGSAVADIERLESLNEEKKLDMLFYRPQEEPKDSRSVRLKLFQKDEAIHLSDVMPMLENLGLRVIGEAPYKVETKSGDTYWILDFSMLHNAHSGFVLSDVRERFQDAFAGIWHGKLENDGFNRLVLNAGLNGREVTILRAYQRYMRQVAFPFSQTYIEDTLACHSSLARLLVELFSRRFNPKKNSEKEQKLIIQKIEDALEQVESLDDDRIIRRYMEMILATLRTNFYQKDKETGEWKEYLSLKLQPSKIPEIPKPVPFFEIFVYSPDVEGVHLRGGKVARGGLRWSDRQEDFRTEVLGLVKAQQVKNTVIVPVGAKGGFVCKKQHSLSNRDEIFAEGQRCYRIFIRGLLDITDNIVEGELTPPLNVVRHDEDDPYLVVAADKGTATFSDLANSVSEEYNFWLGDAFASGGSNGYDHKAMGITAKGGWESVKRHFREIGINCQETDFTCVAIGDMAGDVFGNGMLLSKHIRLLAAFNHMHIFIDPNPDSATSWVERDRLFKMPRSSWEDYDPTLISKGGGVFSRKAKSIGLSPEIQKMLGVRKQSMTPNELIKQILKTKVDLLWNGGIGTYVKAETESHAEVGDRANDAVRVNGNELGARIVGEGGNLGMTQLARIEYAMNGGRVNTDFIDNVGGVDCSDNEVNIKILLNGLVAAGDLTYKQRNELLERMEDEVSEIVLDDAYCQSESISVTCEQQVALLKEQIRFIHYLEKEGKLDRALEYLPDDETLAERQLRGIGLTRPEVAVLVAYGKMVLKEQLVIEQITQDPHFGKLLPAYFPKELQRNYREAMETHPLRSEIIATSLANQMSNDMGFNFITRMQDETGASVGDIAAAYAIAREVFDFEKTFDEIRELDNQLPAQVQYALMFRCRRMMRRTTRWILRNPMKDKGIEEQVAFYKPAVKNLADNLDVYLVPSEIEEHQEQAEEYITQGVPKPIADKIVRLTSLYAGLDLAQVSEQMEKPFDVVARLYFVLGDTLSLHWFLKQITNQPVENHWQALARASFREDLDWQQRMLTAHILEGMNNGESAELGLESWMVEHAVSLGRWESIVAEFKVGTVHEFAKFSVALRELTLLNLN